MKIREIVTETFDNLLPKDRDKKLAIADQVYDILQSSYASQGGIKGSGFQSPEAMADKIPMWEVFRRGKDVKAVTLYKDKSGRKMVATGTDGSREAKLMLAKMLIQDVTSGRSFGEVSGKALAFLQKLLGDELYKHAVPVEKAQEILPNDRLTPVDKFMYTREIGGEEIEKLMVGTPGKKIY